jgi:D-beta-D-heptose 7-phosphate kinase/D-beta-D-heptose 1-phosphate adenosyltransferase
MVSVYAPNKEARIALFGDIMLDHTIQGVSHKIANEAPIPVIHMSNETYSLGGCGNVLSNLVALGAKQVFLFSRRGNDTNGSILTDLLPASITNCMIMDSNSPTITKHRVYCQQTLMCRYDQEVTTCIDVEEEKEIIQRFKEVIRSNRITSVVFSDYNKGFLRKSLCQHIITLCNEQGIPTIVDPKVDYTKYIGCTVVKPNRVETKHIFKVEVREGAFELAHQTIHDLLKCDLSVITMSGDGISGYTKERVHYHVAEDTKEIIDVTGAGDVVTSVLGVFYPFIKDITLLLKIANHLASISVAHLCSYTITETDLINTYKFVHRTKQIQIGCFPTFPNKRIVFTNGCFDILHAGHIALFHFCRSLGDIVIVGLNSDASIQRLKGQSRPIYSLEDRIRMLESIEYIDFIIPFSEDNPFELVRMIRPDYLVKGGDYTKESVIGKEFAKDVVIFNYIEGKSTTQTIQRMKDI